MGIPAVQVGVIIKFIGAVGFLYGPPCGSVITGNGKPQCRTIAELNLFLDESLPELPAADNGTPVVILDGTCEDLAG